MFEKEIRFIYDFYVNKVRSLGSYFTYTQLLTSELHPAILQYITAEIEFLLFEDRQKLLKNSVFDYNSDRVVHYFSLIGDEIKKNKRFSLNYVSKLILHAVSFNINYLVRPKWSLLKFIFDDTTHKTTTEIKQILNYVYFYDHVKSVLIAYLNKKKILSFNETEMKDLLNKIDKYGIESYLPVIIDTALNSMGDFFSSGSLHKSKVPLHAVKLFLEDKNLTPHLDRIKRSFPDDERIFCEIRDLRNILGTVEYDTTEILQLTIDEEPYVEIPAVEDKVHEVVKPNRQTREIFDEKMREEFEPVIEVTKKTEVKNLQEETITETEPQPVEETIINDELEFDDWLESFEKADEEIKSVPAEKEILEQIEEIKAEVVEKEVESPEPAENLLFDQPTEEKPLVENPITIEHQNELGETEFSFETDSIQAAADIDLIEPVIPPITIDVKTDEPLEKNETEPSSDVEEIIITGGLKDIEPAFEDIANGMEIPSAIVETESMSEPIIPLEVNLPEEDEIDLFHNVEVEDTKIGIDENFVTQEDELNRILHKELQEEEPLDSEELENISSNDLNEKANESGAELLSEVEEIIEERKLTGEDLAKTESRELISEGIVEELPGEEIKSPVDEPKEESTVDNMRSEQKETSFEEILQFDEDFEKDKTENTGVSFEELEKQLADIDKILGEEEPIESLEREIKTDSIAGEPIFKEENLNNNDTPMADELITDETGDLLPEPEEEIVISEPESKDVETTADEIIETEREEEQEFDNIEYETSAKEYTLAELLAKDPDGKLLLNIEKDLLKPSDILPPAKIQQKVEYYNVPKKKAPPVAPVVEQEEFIVEEKEEAIPPEKKIPVSSFPIIPEEQKPIVVEEKVDIESDEQPEEKELLLFEQLKSDLIIDDTTDLQKNVNEPPSPETKIELPIEIVKQTSAEIDISELLEHKHMTKILEVIFDYDMEDFSNVIDKVSDCKSKDEAIKVLDEYFSSHRISTSLKEAEIFKSVISEYFDKNR
ncbi:MAG: hypothetical protein V1720_10225 [bacterium]